MWVSDWWEHKRSNELCIDGYGNQVFWIVLKILKSRGYYNNFAEKKAAMKGTYRNYGWQYSAEEYVMGRMANPNKYKDEIPQKHTTEIKRRKKYAL